MIESKIARRFLNKEVGLLFYDSGRDVYIRGVLIDVTDGCAILKTDNGERILSLDSIKQLKELKQRWSDNYE